MIDNLGIHTMVKWRSTVTSPDYDEEIDDHQWHFGLFLQQQWLQDQGQAAINELQNIRRVLHE